MNSLGGGSGSGTDAGRSGNGSSAPKATMSLSDFRAMSDKDVYDYLIGLQDTEVIPGGRNSIAQRLVTALGQNDKPQVVSDSELDQIIKTNGTPELFHTMEESNYGSTGNGGLTSALDVQKSLLYGENNILSGGQAGEGAYFADDYNDSAHYGTIDSPITKSATVRATLSPDAKIISYRELNSLADPLIKPCNAASSELNKEMKKLTKKYGANAYSTPEFQNLLEKQLQIMKVRDAALNATAIKHGYNVIIIPNASMGKNGSIDYYTVINRNALIISNNIRPTYKGDSWQENINKK